ncbi:hypothetical protein BDP27DRAFT_1210035 [Rhodocollybia butyracea]|uniref:DUF6534 domain-containing protein n=1 Tax=Rhodocollybia butyracea TaxID=206335 RepID=A0A9P5UEU1_9AGAR|nr:hypothetical protein BDP27DRAFT_1210035 [Rhodocollybia butyracea]
MLSPIYATDEPHVVVDNTMGAALIGVIARIVSCVQTWFYFSRYPGDLWYIKSLVAIVWVFDSIHQALISHTVYFYVITNFSNAAEQAYLIWSILVSHRSFAFFSKLWTDLTSMKLEVLFNVSFGLLATYRMLVLTFPQGLDWIPSPKVFELFPVLFGKGLSMAVNVLGALSDVVIAAGLFYFLHRSRTGFKKSDTMISKLIAFSVSTGLLTSVCAVASLLSIIIWGKTLIYVAFYFSLGRLYSNSLLATLNARKSIRYPAFDFG